mgnify:CR=1 FL=1
MHTATIELPSRWQPDLFADPEGQARFEVATTPEIESALDHQAPVFIGVSGEQDHEAYPDLPVVDSASNLVKKAY